MRRIPLYDASAPVACTLEPADVPERLALLERLGAQVIRADRTEHGLLLHLHPGEELEADVRRFAVDEGRCCRFWGFAVEATANELRLRWDGPPEAAPLLDELLTHLEGGGPLTLLDRLL